jgi:hypothetical protein
MHNPAGEGLVSADETGGTLHKRDFWSKENLKYSRPHYRLEKSARIINRLTRGQALAQHFEIRKSFRRLTIGSTLSLSGNFSKLPICISALIYHSLVGYWP